MRYFIGLILLAFSICNYADQMPFKTYKNLRFNYQVDYPATLKPAQPPANGSGLQFLNGGGDLTVYGSFHPEANSQTSEEHYNIQEEFDWEKQNIRSKGFELGYTRLKADMFVITGVNKVNIVYLKKVYVPKCGVHLYLWLYFPTKDKSQWSPWVDEISRSFKYSSMECRGDYRSG